MEALVLELKNRIIEALDLEDITPGEIDENVPLFDNGLGLDPTDTLELIVLPDKYYGIRLDNSKKGKKIFGPVTSIVQYITAHRTK